MIADLEELVIDDDSLALIARSGEGSMRDAESALDQVVAFAGGEVTVDDVSAVLGLIGRDPVFDVVELVANEDPSAVFELSGRFVEAGYDLRLVCRELTRAVRDLLVILVDPARVDDPEIASDSERPRLVEISKRFSREDLMRAFDVLTKAEFEIRSAAHPRYHFEMAVLKWIHLRKLVPLTALLEGTSTSVSMTAPSATVSARRSSPPPRSESTKPASGPARKAVPASPRVTSTPTRPTASPPTATPTPGTPTVATAPSDGATNNVSTAEILAEVKRVKKFFHGTVVAQAQRNDLEGDKLVFRFAPGQRTLAAQLKQNRGWLEQLASKVAGHPITVSTDQQGAGPEPRDASTPSEPSEDDRLREHAMNDPVVQSMLEVFPAEIGKIEKIE